MQRFPSLVICKDGLRAAGAFAEAQRDFLDPDPATVAELDALLASKHVGVVAHFYMDPELQGVLAACPTAQVHVSDSLVMADKAVEMVEKGARRIVVLGVDFMAENARAMLDAAGHRDVPVYRVVAEPIGCSLATAAESPAYAAFLAEAARTPRSLHVVYINTSLRTKARAEAVLPTIACTSSNVVKTILTAFAEDPEGHVWFGPDTYMGENLARMLERYAELPDAQIRSLHPAHDRASLRAARARFHWFGQGACVVHHLFGASVTERVRREHADAYVTAHLEVPGEMFALALEKAAEGRGVAGSTSSILDFIAREVAAHRGQRLSFVLGTEAGMITSIVRAVRALIDDRTEVEIVFPVAAEAVSQTGDRDLAIVPGVAGGEGCSTAGGCATCPYMKMSSLDRLLDLARKLDTVPDAALAGLRPREYPELVAGRTVADLGSVPILRMRKLGKTGTIGETASGRT
jgi:quinolinate synthase